MKVGVAYNVFDGVELLPLSVASIKKHVDFICAVYQTESNYGEKSEIGYNDLFFKLGLDFSIHYTPKTNGRNAHNEVAKRNEGLIACTAAGCDIFLTMDCDEVYNPLQFERAKNKFIESGKKSSACQMLTYYHDYNQVFDPPETYHVPLFYRLDGRRFREPTPWPVVADPTRKLSDDDVLLFDRDEIEMHHLSYIRNDIGLKCRNSSSHRLRNAAGEIEKYYKNWLPGMPGYFAGGKYVSLKTVDDVRNMVDAK
jgi:hypothetical protein